MNFAIVFIISDTTSKLVEKDTFDDGQLQRQSHLEAIAPPLNKNAKELSNVYNISELIGENLLERLENEALEVLKTSPENLP